MPVSSPLSPSQRARVTLVPLALLSVPSLALAQQSPWERAAANLEATFTGPLARSLALVAIVIGGLLFMFAAQFLAWLF